MDENQDEAQNPLNHQNWMKQTNWKFIKYVIHNRHSMTPEQLKQKPFEEIFKKQHEKFGTEEGESNEEAQKSTTSSEKSEQGSDGTSTEDEEESNTIETPQIHHDMNETTHDEEKPSEDEDDTTQDENVAEMQTYENNGEKNVQEDKLLSTNFAVKVENHKSKGP